MMTNEKMREEFEFFMKKEMEENDYFVELLGCGDIESNFWQRYDGSYKSDLIEYIFQAWQASRENIEVELPSDRYSIIDTFDTDGNLEDSGIYSSSDGEFYKVKEVKQKLTEQGFKLKWE